jgi:hypothetical protein
MKSPTSPHSPFRSCAPWAPPSPRGFGRLGCRAG